jgi:hypothetical protein
VYLCWKRGNIWCFDRTYADPTTAIVKVTDVRFDWLVQHFRPKKAVGPHLSVTDIAGFTLLLSLFHSLSFFLSFSLFPSDSPFVISLMSSFFLSLNRSCERCISRRGFGKSVFVTHFELRWNYSSHSNLSRSIDRACGKWCSISLSFSLLISLSFFSSFKQRTFFVLYCLTFFFITIIKESIPLGIWRLFFPNCGQKISKISKPFPINFPGERKWEEEGERASRRSINCANAF